MQADHDPMKTDVPQAKGRSWPALLASLLFFAVLVAYFAGHKPISPSGLRSLVAAVGDLLLTVVIVGLGGGIGRRLAPDDGDPAVHRTVVQAALGLGCLALLVLALLWISALQTAVLWSALIVLAIIFGKSSMRWFVSWQRLKPYRPTNGAEVAAALAVVAFLGLGLVEAFAPPVHFDALVYHLDLPQRFVSLGSLFAPTDNLYWGLPLTGEMLYTLGMALGRPQTAAVLGFAAALLTCAGVFALGCEFGRPAAWAAVLALLVGPSLAASSGWGYVDWWAALFGLAVIAVIARREPDLGLREAALAGALAGFAGGVKYTAAIALPAGFLAVLSGSPNRRGLRMGLVFLVTGLLVLSPWLVKNLAETGSPLYPYFGGLDQTSQVRQSGLIGSVPVPPIVHSAAVPLAATVIGFEQAQGFASDIGPLLVALLPGLALLRRPLRRILLPVGVFLLTGWGLWAVASQVSGLLVQTRLYFVLLPAWALLAGCGFLALSQVSLGSVRLGRVIGALMALVVALSLLQQARTAALADPLSAVLGAESDGEYLSRRLGGSYASQARLAQLPAGSKTLMLWEPRGYYCWPGCIPDVWIDQWYVARRTLGTPEAILGSWDTQGITHVLLFNAGMEFVRANDRRYSEDDWQALQLLLQKLRPIETIGDGYTLYRIDR